MRDFRSDHVAAGQVGQQNNDSIGAPGKRTLVEQLPTPPGDAKAVVERAEQRLARPGYNYLEPFARPLLAALQTPDGGSPAARARLEQLFEVSKTGGGGELAPVKAASNAYHAKLGAQASAELTASQPAGAAADARAATAAAGRSLAAKYTPLLEDDVQLQVQLGAVSAPAGGQAPSISVEITIAPNDWSWRALLCCMPFQTQWSFRGTPATQQPSDERTPLLRDQPEPHVGMPAPPATTSSDGHAPPAPALRAEPPAPEAPSPEVTAEVDAFVGRFTAKGEPTARPVPTVVRTPAPPVASGKGKATAAKQTGYVVNMASTPGEVHAEMASRYFAGAWEGTADAGAATARTAVVVGVNSFLGMDEQADATKAAAVTGGVARVAPPASGQIAVFGYTWEPGWQADKAPVSLATVRDAWKQLSSGARGAAATKMDEQVKDALPYGFFRNQVLESAYTKEAVASVGQVADPVHIVVQDADGGVQPQPGKGILTAYDEVLPAVEPHPLLTIGGYHYKGFEWPSGQVPTQRLTELANDIDRAVRQAISTVYPEMLYPTEPNMLIKAQDAQHKDGVFDRQIENPFGTGTAEGRTARQNILRADKASAHPHAKPVAYEPSTSTMTSPVPERLERGLTVPATPEYIAKAETGELYKERTSSNKSLDQLPADKKHAALVVEHQAQNTLNARRLAYEFAQVYPVTDEKVPSSVQDKAEKRFDPAVKKVHELIDSRGEVPAEASNASEAPSTSVAAAVTAPAPTGGKPAKAVKTKPAKAPTPADIALRRVDDITTAIVAAMTTVEMRAKLAELRTLLDEVKQQGDAHKHTAPEGSDGPT